MAHVKADVALLSLGRPDRVTFERKVQKIGGKIDSKSMPEEGIAYFPLWQGPTGSQRYLCLVYTFGADGRLVTKSIDDITLHLD